MTHDELVVHLRGLARHNREIVAPALADDFYVLGCLQAADTIEQMREEIAGLRTGLWSGKHSRVPHLSMTSKAWSRNCAPCCSQPMLPRTISRTALNRALPPIAETKE
jgi:hypothetical protein